jgi:hypothetical protein
MWRFVLHITNTDQMLRHLSMVQHQPHFLLSSSPLALTAPHHNIKLSLQLFLSPRPSQVHAPRATNDEESPKRRRRPKQRVTQLTRQPSTSYRSANASLWHVIRTYSTEVWLITLPS